MEKLWESDGKAVGKLWETGDKQNQRLVGKLWKCENGGTIVENNAKRMEKVWLNCKTIMGKLQKSR